MSDWSRVPVLAGRHVRLEPLATEHAGDLSRAAQDGELWQNWFTSVPRPEAMADYVEGALTMQANGKALVFVVRDAAGEVVGSTRFYDLDPATPRVQVGYTWLARRVQKTALNTEAKALLLTHAFEHLHCASVGFQTSWFNHGSRAAIERLGAKQEGVLRAHMRHADGSVRDTVCYSIVASEWPAVKTHLQDKLRFRSATS